MTEFAIESPARMAAFIAQLAHESGQFRFMEEIWGPTPAQQRYEPPSSLATDLGNTDAGDGKRFKGRGPIQITGRANYRALVTYCEWTSCRIRLGPRLLTSRSGLLVSSGRRKASTSLPIRRPPTHSARSRSASTVVSTAWPSDRRSMPPRARSSAFCRRQPRAELGGQNRFPKRQRNPYSSAARTPSASTSGERAPVSAN